MVFSVVQVAVGDGADGVESSWPPVGCGELWQEGIALSPWPAPKLQCTKHNACAATNTTSVIVANERDSGLKVA